jgi:hypothetical protein
MTFMRIPTLLASIFFAFLVCSGCSEQKSTTRNVTADLNDCKGEIDSAMAEAQRTGQPDSQVFRAGQVARDRCMQRKGY